ncbi:MAG TPA: hypothetical protein VFI65_13705 [Streptosporangiaceae bacterium]|nr:hypothetical protein [Streptosporangiaceae bacterium]
MPLTTQAPDHFSLSAPQVRRQQQLLRNALACYLPAGALLTFLAPWVADRGPLGAGLIALSAVQVDFYALVASAQIAQASRDLRLAGTAAGQLTLSGEGLSDARRLIAWPQVRQVRVCRDGVQHVAVTWLALAGGSGPSGVRGCPPASGVSPRASTRPGWFGRRKNVWLPSRYGVSPDELAAAFERHVAVEDPGRARAPVFDDPPGTVRFFANLGGLQTQRRRYLRSFWRIPLMTGPAAVGLFIASQPLAGGLVLAVTSGLLLRQYGKLAALVKPLRLGRNGYGRMLLSAEHLTLAGTDVAISWSHVHEAKLSRTGRTGLDGLIRCPEPEPDEACRYRGRTIKFHIADSLFSATVDDIGAAFGRHVDVADG